MIEDIQRKYGVYSFKIRSNWHLDDMDLGAICSHIISRQMTQFNVKLLNVTDYNSTQQNMLNNSIGKDSEEVGLESNGFVKKSFKF